MKTSHTNETFPELIREAGFKVTPARLALLNALKDSGKPLSIAEISKRLSKVADQATVYRSLEAFAKEGIVQKVDFQDSHTYYELVLGCAHHHHVVCQNCGTIEDVEICDVKGLEATALKQVKKFKAIKSHSLEFFGTCTKCA
jgi:Fur family ferric uptake transcriptional regulator